jgi:hypothetical protein
MREDCVGIVDGNFCPWGGIGSGINMSHSTFWGMSGEISLG